MMDRRIARALGCVAAGLTVAAGACGSDGTGKVSEDRIREQVEKRTGRKLSELTCSSSSGATESGLICRATFEGGEQVRVEVVGTGLAGGIELRIEGESPGERLALRITDELTSHYGPEFQGTVCPPVEVRKNMTFECTARLRDGTKLPVTAKWTDDQGHYEFVDKGVIVLDRVETAIRTQLAAAGTPGKVDCPGALLPSEPGTDFECSLDYESGTSGFAVVTVNDWNGKISWEID